MKSLAALPCPLTNPSHKAWWNQEQEYRYTGAAWRKGKSGGARVFTYILTMN